MITTKDLTFYMIGIKPANKEELTLMPHALKIEVETCVLLCIPRSQMEKWEKELP